MQNLQEFGWLLNLKKSVIVPTQRLEYLGLRLDSMEARVVLPSDKLQTLRSVVKLLMNCKWSSLRFCMRVLGLMMAFFETVSYAQFHTRVLQKEILTKWDKSQLSLDRQIQVSQSVRNSLIWWLRSPVIQSGKSFLPLKWTVITTDTSLSGWGGVIGVQSPQGLWSTEESKLPINLLELRAIRRCLSTWSMRLQGHPIRIQSDNATAVAYVNHQGETRSSATAWEVAHILRLAKRHIPALLAIYIPGVENWQADYLSRQMLDPGEWKLHPEIFRLLCLKWSKPDVDLLASHLNQKVPRFMSRTRDPWADASAALVALWDQYQLIYAFPPLNLLPRLLQRGS
ncbi:uncharacterized protein LOC143982996 [Lithobates pipiens]